MSRTSVELKKLEERRRSLLKLKDSGKGGPVADLNAELDDIDDKIAAAMGVPVQALAGMRPK